MSKKFNDMDWHIDKSGALRNSQENLHEVKKLLDSTGCGMCLAKFKQVTMHLGTGTTHSCHHPRPHKIPLDELEANPAALFNTKHLKTARKQMLNGDRPAECDYCWRVEDSGDDALSDRAYKSIETWAIGDHDKIVELTGDENIYPSYLEVDFSNVCNMKCIYCGPEYSSKWVGDLRQNGPYKVHAGTKHEDWVNGWQNLDSLNYKKSEHNPYIEAFWKWFPDALPHLKNYRITGGEPLMSKETFKSMEWLIDNPNPELEFSINSNFSVPDKLWNRFIELVAEMRPGIHVKRITIYTSVEGWKERAEYARVGLNFDLLQRRYEQILALGNIRCTIMAAYNMLSITSFQQLLEWQLELKRKFNPNNSLVTPELQTGFTLLQADDPAWIRKDKNESQPVTVGLDIPYLRNPKQLDAQISTHELVDDYMIPQMTFMADNTWASPWSLHQGFEEYETEKLRRLILHRMYFHKKNAVLKPEHEKLVFECRAGFYDYINQVDERNKSDFLSTFPEMTDFYNVCKENWKDLNGK